MLAFLYLLLMSALFDIAVAPYRVDGGCERGPTWTPPVCVRV